MSIILAKEEKTLLLVENGPFLSYFGCFFLPSPKEEIRRGKMSSLPKTCPPLAPEGAKHEPSSQRGTRLVLIVHVATSMARLRSQTKTSGISAL